MFSQAVLFTFSFTAAHFHITGRLTFLIFSSALDSPGGQDGRNMDIYHQVKQYRLNAPLKLKKGHFTLVILWCGRRAYVQVTTKISWMHGFSYPWCSDARDSRSRELRYDLGGVYMTPGLLARRREFTPVPSALYLFT